jgi:outer membrane receptor protein involved in Fe transport
MPIPFVFALALAAQEPAAPAPPPAPAPAPAQPAAPGTTVGEVVVTGTAAPVRASIDRRSYSVTGDLHAQTGSIADALRNIPSVQVDLEGNLSLRGDPNVVIMIDGQPSSLFRGDGRAQALQQMPAERIERVEVITNPSAEFRADGSAGVINLVTKRQQGGGNVGSLRLQGGNRGRFGVTITGGHNGRRLSYSGDASYRHDAQRLEAVDERARFDADAGAFAFSRQETAGRAKLDVVNLRGGLDYNISPRDRLSFEARAMAGKQPISIVDAFELTSATGVVTGFERITDQREVRRAGQLLGTWRHRYPGEGHELVTTANVEQRLSNLDRESAIGPALEAFSQNNATRVAGIKLDYTRPLSGMAKLKTGVDLDVETADLDASGSRNGAPAGALTNLFLFDQTLAQAYVTYERPMGKLTALAGLRAEAVGIDLDQVTQGLVDGQDYRRLYPSLHLAYDLAEGRKLTASYSHRVTRPSPQDLNPYRVVVDPLNLRAGNPQLAPQDTHSYELGYERRKGQTMLLATLYWRQTENAFTEVVRPLADGTFLTTRENLGESQAGGLELVANGRLNKKMTYNVSGNAFWTEIQSDELGLSEPRSATTLFGRANLNWQVSAKDFIQVNGFLNGKRLTPQGYARPTGAVNLGYRRKFDDKVSLLFTVSDVFRTQRQRLVLNTPTLRQDLRRRTDSRVFTVSLVWTLTGRPREAGFEFGGPEAASQ